MRDHCSTERFSLFSSGLDSQRVRFFIKRVVEYTCGDCGFNCTAGIRRHVELLVELEAGQELAVSMWGDHAVSFILVLFYACFYSELSLTCECHVYNRLHRANVVGGGGQKHWSSEGKVDACIELLGSCGGIYHIWRVEM